MSIKNAIKETKRHGLINFPFEVYRVRLPETFPQFPIHYHEEFEVVYILEGALDTIINSERFTCRQGDIIVIPPETVHGFYQHEGERCHYTNIVFSLNLLESRDSEIFDHFFKPYFEKTLKVPYFYPKDSEMNEKMLPSVLCLFEYRHDVIKEPLLIKAELYKLMSIFQKVSLPTDTHISTAEANVKRLLPVFKFVRENPDSSLSVKEAAELVNLSESYFMSMFKSVSGTSFTNFIKMTHLENARVMLLGTDETILDVSEKCGFENVSYFIRSFKKAYGYSPLQYKKMRKKTEKSLEKHTETHLEQQNLPPKS